MVQNFDIYTQLSICNTIVFRGLSIFLFYASRIPEGQSTCASAMYDTRIKATRQHHTTVDDPFHMVLL